jgi:hypothetical protein
MASALRFSSRFICLISVTCLLYLFYFGDFSSTFWPFSNTPSQKILKSLSLTDEQCKATFPKLTKEIDDAVARGPFRLEKEPDDYQGLVQARIKDGKVCNWRHVYEHYMLSKSSFISSLLEVVFRGICFMYVSLLHSKIASLTNTKERDAILHQIHRAIVTSPEPLPDTIFAFSILDTIRQSAWCFARSNDPKIKGNYWIMPHFSYWSWPKSFIGTVEEAVARIQVLEKEIPWSKKISKVVWRGTAWFNSIGNTALRPNLLATTKDKAWADVEVSDWGTNADSAKNAIKIEDFCKYKYIIYTEVSVQLDVVEVMLTMKGCHILWSPTVSSSMRIRHHHSTTYISYA